MGVTGLWKLIEPSGKAVPLETLENKILAIDISIWLHQVIKGFQDNKGNALAQAHLLGLFHRLCKLLYYRIKPIFVFDGSVPQIKRDTIAKRQQNRNKILNEADRIQDLLLQTLAKERVVQQALGSKAIELLTSPQKKTKIPEKPEKEDMFKLPELPIIHEEDFNDSQTSIDSSCNSSDTSFDERNLRCSYNNQLQSIDVTSKHFLSLPADIRHEILVDIKETRKQSSWGRLHELPPQLPDFSSFQMKRLLKRRQVQVSLENAEKEMGGKSLTFNELQHFLSEEGVVPMAANCANKKICSDENTRFLLIRDLKKAMEKAEQMEQLKKQELANKELEKQENEVGDEFEDDLQLAIQMSLENDAVYKDTDYDCDSVKLNRQQRTLLKDSAKTLAKDYLIEYGGMNEEDIADLLNNTEYSQDLSFKYNDLTPLKQKRVNKIATDVLQIQDFILESGHNNQETKEGELLSTANKDKTKGANNTEAAEIGIMSDDSDSDFEIVLNEEKYSNKPSTSKSESPSTSDAIKSKNIEITIDLTKEMNEDLFADVFSQPTNLSSDNEVNNSQSIEIDKVSEKVSDGVKMNNVANMPEGLVPEISSQPISLSSGSEISNSQSIEINSNIVVSEKVGDQFNKKIVDLVKSKVQDIVLKDIKNTLEDEIEIYEKKTEDNKTQERKYELDLSSPIKFSTIKEQNETTNSKENIKAILDNLKDEVADIKKLTFDDIKLNNSIFEIEESDEEDFDSSKSDPKILIKLNNEVIEINDDDRDGPTQITPSKRNINEYFKTNSSTKISNVEDIVIEHIPKVKSPFFVNKSPKSIEKQKYSHDNKPNVVKSLFIDETKIINPVDIAAEVLRENKTHEELTAIATGLATETRSLEIERNRQDRMAVGITEKMNLECMELLKLFGIPYVCAPMEAEAQCAFLNAVHVTDGTITDDSDIWLFGGETVYKNFFNQQKHVLEFQMKSIEKNFSVDRHKLIQLAFLVGSDYTTGINGIGAVTALEILAAFPSTPIKDNEVTETMSILSSLRKFREWYKNGRNIGPGGKTILKNKLKNIDVSEHFPNFSVVDAYLNPKVDKNDEAFSWGVPDIATILEFTRTKFGWTRLKTEEILKPVLKRLNEKQSQTSIKNYFKVTMAASKKELHLSKRVQKAINKMSNDNKEEDEPVPPKRKPPKTKKNKIAVVDNVEVNSVNLNNNAIHNTGINKICKEIKQRQPKRKEQCSTSKEELDSQPVIKVAKKIANIPSTSQVIPQREKDKVEMEKKKELAAVLFKRTKNTV